MLEPRPINEERARRPLAILVAGEALPEVAAVHGSFSAWIRAAAAPAWAGPWLEHDLRSGEEPPGAGSVSGIIITGSAASVTERASWMLRAEAHLRELVHAEVPIFGICFGHQLLGQALGGEVRKNPRGREIGTVAVTTVADDELFAGLPATIRANSTHVDVVAELPPGARVLATTALDPHAAIAFAPVVRGVQFHPEFAGAVMRGYVEVRRPLLLAEGLDADAIGRAASDTPDARELIANFIRSFVQAGARRAA